MLYESPLIIEAVLVAPSYSSGGWRGKAEAAVSGTLLNPDFLSGLKDSNTADAAVVIAFYLAAVSKDPSLVATIAAIPTPDTGPDSDWATAAASRRSKLLAFADKALKLLPKGPAEKGGLKSAKDIAELVFKWELKALSIRGTGTKALFATAGAMKHACVANCHILLIPGGQAVVYSLEPIAVGTALSVSLITPMLPTAARQTKLLSSWGIRCTCDRCTFRPEYVRAFKCTVCRTGAVCPHSSDETNISNKLFVSTFGMEGLSMNSSTSQTLGLTRGGYVLVSRTDEKGVKRETMAIMRRPDDTTDLNAVRLNADTQDTLRCSVGDSVTVGAISDVPMCSKVEFVCTEIKATKGSTDLVKDFIIPFYADACIPVHEGDVINFPGPKGGTAEFRVKSTTPSPLGLIDEPTQLVCDGKSGSTKGWTPPADTGASEAETRDSDYFTPISPSVIDGDTKSVSSRSSSRSRGSDKLPPPPPAPISAPQAASSTPVGTSSSSGGAAAGTSASGAAGAGSSSSGSKSGGSGRKGGSSRKKATPPPVPAPPSSDGTPLDPPYSPRGAGNPTDPYRYWRCTSCGCRVEDQRLIDSWLQDERKAARVDRGALGVVDTVKNSTLHQQHYLIYAAASAQLGGDGSKAKAVKLSEENQAEALQWMIDGLDKVHEEYSYAKAVWYDRLGEVQAARGKKEEARDAYTASYNLLKYCCGEDSMVTTAAKAKAEAAEKAK